MDDRTKVLLDEAMEICDEEDKSTGYMIEFMQDFAGVSYDCVMDYLAELICD